METHGCLRRFNDSEYLEALACTHAPMSTHKSGDAREKHFGLWASAQGNPACVCAGTMVNMGAMGAMGADALAEIGELEKAHHAAR